MLIKPLTKHILNIVIFDKNKDKHILNIVIFDKNKDKI